MFQKRNRTRKKNITEEEMDKTDRSMSTISTKPYPIFLARTDHSGVSGRTVMIHDARLAVHAMGISLPRCDTHARSRRRVDGGKKESRVFKKKLSKSLRTTRWTRSTGYTQTYRPVPIERLDPQKRSRRRRRRRSTREISG